MPFVVIKTYDSPHAHVGRNKVEDYEDTGPHKPQKGIFNHVDHRKNKEGRGHMDELSVSFTLQKAKSLSQKGDEGLQDYI